MCARNNFSVLIVSFFVLVSCSVKSDRSICPAYLYLSVFGGDEASLSVDIKSDGHNELTHISKSDGMAIAGFDLKKGTKYSITCLSGVSQGWNGIVSVGEQMPRLYAFADSFICYDDIKVMSIHLNKQYARIILTVSGIECAARVRCDVSGLDLTTLAPVSGQFCYETSPSMKSKDNLLFFMDVPRQLDDSMMLELISEKGGNVLKSIPVGKEIINSGIDWSKPSLDDIYLEIKYVDGQCTVEVQNWDRVSL